MEAKDSPYYMGNHECLPTEFTIKTTEHVVKQELPWDANMEDLCQAFYGACVASILLFNYTKPSGVPRGPSHLQFP